MRPKSTIPVLPAAALVWLFSAGPCRAQSVSVTVAVTPKTVTLTRGQGQQFAAAVACAPGPCGDAGVTWTVSGIGSVSTSGYYTAPASVFGTDPTIVTVKAISRQDPSASDTATVTLIPTVAITISPASVTLAAGAQQQFTVTVTGTSNTGFNCVAVPNIGNITGCRYTAPVDLTTSQTVSIIATSSADPTKSAAATVTVMPGNPVSVSISPTAVTLNNSQSQQFSATVTGAPVTDVTWSINPSIGSITSAGVYTAPGSLVAPVTVIVTAKSAYDPTKSSSAVVSLVPIFVSVAVSPATAALNPGQSQQFTATVSGTDSQAVTWSISPSSGAGTISSSGLYTAPSNFTSMQTVTVTAKSVVDPSKGGSATVTLVPVAGVTVKPAITNLTASQTEQFTATVTGASNTDVTWSMVPGDIGTLSATGLYTAPQAIGTAATIAIIATSVADPSKSGRATVNLMPSSTVSVSIAPKTVTLTPSQTQQFTVTVSGSVTTEVNWVLNPPNLGSITAGGLYTAPSTVTSTQTVTVTAIPMADPGKSAAATVTLAPQTVAVDVGVGAPNDAIRSLFIQAFYRNGFYNLVSLPPVGQVRRWGNGLIQEFYDTNKTSGVRLALVKADATTAALPGGTEDALLVFQVTHPLENYYSSVGTGTAGYPTMDARSCPAFDAINSCVYALFSNNYALFAYTNSLYTGTNFAIRANFYLKWTALGGINGPGRPVDGETSVTSSASGTAITATTQAYANGAIYSITSGPMNGQVYGVLQPMYALYLSNGGHAGYLGFPISNEMVLASGVHRQTFQGGAIDWNPGSDPELRPPVATVTLSAAGAVSNVLRMNYGESATVTAAIFGANGIELAGRPVAWTSSNSRVVTVQQTGYTTTLKAAGGGTAQVTASSEGKSSKPLTVMVAAQCCMVGEGSPTAAVEQAFFDAVARNRLLVQVPGPSPVERAGAGYVQLLRSADPSVAGSYLLAKPDRLATAYVVTGEILRHYQALGGPAGALGYPIADASPGGRQMFENSAALAGDPVTLVGGAVLAKWGLLGYETGVAGLPRGAASPFDTFGANSGDMQAFANGLIVCATAGPRAGQSSFVSGPILDRYMALGGPAGPLGMPLSDEFDSAGLHEQKFEGGSIDYAAGDAVAREHAAERKPAVLAAPGSVVPGGRVRLAVAGFPPGSTVRVSVSGQPDFIVTTATGAYTWEVFVPLSAKPGEVVIHAADLAGTASADASYTVRAFAEMRAQLVKVSGDGQTGVPGARLPLPLRVALRDSSGNPIAGAPVSFEGSPGASVAPASAVTDSSGMAETVLRLPPAEGTAAVVVNAPSVALTPVTFMVLASSSSLPNFPKLQQSGDTRLGNGAATVAQKGALLTAAAAMLRYHQARGELSSPNGLAGPAALNQYLTGFCAVDAAGGQVCDGFLANPDSGEQVVNLWRVGGFAGGAVDVSIEKSEIDNVRDFIAQGSPVLLSLALTVDGAAAGGHFVVATGVSGDGAVMVHDPNPVFAHPNLSDYLSGFSAGGRAWKAELRGAVRFLLRPPGPSRFLLAAISQPVDLMQAMALDARSAIGACAPALELQDAAVPGVPAAPLVSRFVACEGSAPAYQIDVGVSRPWRATVTDLGSGGRAFDLAGSAPAAYKAARPLLHLSIGPQDAVISAGGVVNAATFTPGIAPGGLFAIFGAGLMAAGVTTIVEIDGVPVRVVAATPFQVNAEVPLDLSPGSHILRIRSPYGSAEQPVDVQAVAPAIFVLGDGRAAVVNQNGSLNAPASPLARGQTLVIYATGLGAVARQGSLSIATEPVTAVLNGQELRPAFAGLTPGFVGLYQVNVQVPVSSPPGTGLRLTLRQAGVQSNTVTVSVQ